MEPDTTPLVSISLFVSALVITMTVVKLLFVNLYPRSILFWKRSDYVYFGFAIFGVLIGLAELAVRGWQKQLQDLEIQQTNTMTRLAANIEGAVQICEEIRSYEEEQAQREQWGMLDDSLERKPRLFNAKDLYTPTDCRYVDAVSALLYKTFIAEDEIYNSIFTRVLGLAANDLPPERRKELYDAALKETRHAEYYPDLTSMVTPELKGMLGFSGVRELDSHKRVYKDIMEPIDLIDSYHRKASTLRSEVEGMGWILLVRGV